MTTKEFIERARKLYGDKYDYSKVEYIKSKKNVNIICPIHGEFTQTPDNHLHNHGCKYCAIEEQHKEQRKKLSVFIEQANKKHNNKYDYSKVNYTKNDVKVTIICPKHGEFKQRPNDHLSGKGCRKCSYEQRGINHRLTNKEFLEKAKLIHNSKYDYSLTKYNGYDNDIEIICSIHGAFQQNAYSHLQGHGCQKCNASKLELEIENALKENDIKYIPQCNSRIFHWLGLQSLDFYLPDYNIAIECQGDQHFQCVDFSGVNEERAINEFDYTVERDKRKSTKCKENGVRLLYFTHKKFLKSENNVLEGEYFFNSKEIINILNGEETIYKKVSE